MSFAPRVPWRVRRVARRARQEAQLRAGLATRRWFAQAFYEIGRRKDGTWSDTRWMGVPVRKSPFDLWVYQEIVSEVRPDVVIETGTADGGSALFYAHLLDLVGNGRVVSIDVEHRTDWPEHPRIRYLTGSSTDPTVIADVLDEAAGTVLVALDSDHAASHVRRELDLYAPLVSVGSYLVVEDTNVNGHPVLHDHGPGPMEAVRDFLSTTDEFEIDSTREKYLVSHNPSGWLRRVRPSAQTESAFANHF